MDTRADTWPAGFSLALSASGMSANDQYAAARRVVSGVVYCTVCGHINLGLWHLPTRSHVACALSISMCAEHQHVTPPSLRPRAGSGPGRGTGPVIVHTSDLRSPNPTHARPAPNATA